MSLSDKIEKSKKLAEGLSNCVDEDFKEEMKNISFQSDLKRIINDDLMDNNPEKIFEQYKEYFITKNLPKKRIDTKTVFYRGRVGNKVLYGANDDQNRNFILPYYQKDIEAPPPIYTNGGRFNRQGISYLYLADTIETCLAEVHLQIGQNCSVGEFKCKAQIDLIDLTSFNDDFEMKAWLQILTRPVPDGEKYIYNITRFLSDVLKSINNNGIYMESVQAKGHNIVCFDPTLFELIKYSEKIYIATKIQYGFHQLYDAVREFSDKQNSELNSFNEKEEERREEEFVYLNDWIEYNRTMRYDTTQL